MEQVLKAGEAAQKKRPAQRLPVEFDALVRECMELARTRHHLQPDDLDYRESLGATRMATEPACWAIPRNCARQSRTCSTMP